MTVDFQKMRADAHAIADALPDDLLQRWVALGRALRQQSEAKTPEEIRLWKSVARTMWEDHELFKRLALVDSGPENRPSDEWLAESQARIEAEDAARLEAAQARHLEKHGQLPPGTS